MPGFREPENRLKTNVLPGRLKVCPRTDDVNKDGCTHRNEDLQPAAAE